MARIVFGQNNGYTSSKEGVADINKKLGYEALCYDKFPNDNDEDYALTDNELQALKQILKEYVLAKINFKPFHSAHEGYAVLLEEVDELWEEVKVNQTKREAGKMGKEAIQVASMALRFLVDIAMDKERIKV